MSRRRAFGRLPIRLRLTLAFAVVLAIVLAVGGVALYAVFADDLDSQIDRDLDARLADVARLPVPTRSGEEIVQVYDSGGGLLASSRAVAGERLLTPVEVRRAPLEVERSETPVGDARLGTGTGPAGVVVVGAPLDARDHALERLRELLLVVGPLALLLATYAGYQVAGAALRPVERMRARAEQVTERDSSERLPVPSTGDEIEALGRTLNALLARLDAALTRERRMLADASHELRTPLSVLRTEVQLALRGERDAAELRAALESAAQEAERLSRLAEDLLVLARADQGRLPLRAGPVAVEELLAAAATRAAPAAQAAGRQIVVGTSGGAPAERSAEPAGALAVDADADRVAQALDNLVANALAHGAGEVRLAASTADGLVELHVTDEGDGVPAELLEHAFDRFSRGDTARSGDGTGLGLAIVAAIARAHGGTAGVRNSPGGGADAWIALPPA
jgi:signal transduction histidine kinase